MIWPCCRPPRIARAGIFHPERADGGNSQRGFAKAARDGSSRGAKQPLSLIHISEPTRLALI
eukprot:10317662-Alexandrium_andersonii.AAC.1